MRLRLSFLSVLLVTLGLLALSSHAHAFTIIDTDISKEDGMLVLDARSSIEMSEQSLEALEAGVSLVIVMQIHVFRQRSLLWDKRVTTIERRFRLQQHALSKRYLITDLKSDDTRTYQTLSRALDILGDLETITLLAPEQRQADANYYGRMRVWLDIEELPAPLRPVAYLSSGWHLDTDWQNLTVLP